MEDLLKRLLNAELQGEAKVDDASRERARMVQQALEEARAAEAGFETGLADLKQPYLKQAEARAEQAGAELARQYAERQRDLRRQAQEHEAAAREAALALLLGGEPGAS